VAKIYTLVGPLALRKLRSGLVEDQIATSAEMVAVTPSSFPNPVRDA